MKTNQSIEDLEHIITYAIENYFYFDTCDEPILHVYFNEEEGKYDADIDEAIDYDGKGESDGVYQWEDVVREGDDASEPNPIKVREIAETWISRLG